MQGNQDRHISFRQGACGAESKTFWTALPAWQGVVAIAPMSIVGFASGVAKIWREPFCGHTPAQIVSPCLFWSVIVERLVAV